MNKVKIGLVFVSLLLVPFASFATKSPAKSNASATVTNASQASVEGTTNTVNAERVVNSTTTSVGDINVTTGYVFVPEQEVRGALCFSFEALSALDLMKIEEFAEERGLEWERRCLHGGVLEDGYYAPILVQRAFLAIPGSRIYLEPSNDGRTLIIIIGFLGLVLAVFLIRRRQRG
jgi:hypothetical protein